MQQVRLFPPGCQTWDPTLVRACSAKNLTCYSSSLAVFVYDLDRDCIKTIIAGQCVKPISCLAWCPFNPDVIVFGSYDGKLMTWNIETGGAQPIKKCSFSRSAPLCVDWTKHPNKLAVATVLGDVIIWDTSKNTPREMLKFLTKCGEDACRPTVLQCNRSERMRIAVGYKDGRIKIFTDNGKEGFSTEALEAPWEGTEDTPNSRKLSIFKSTKKETQAIKKSNYAVVDAEFDPFSPIYLLVAYKINCIVLWDCETKLAMNVFDCKSIGVGCLVWQGWAPGNFMSCSDKSGILTVWNVSQPKRVFQTTISDSGLEYLHIDKDICAYTATNGSVGSFNARTLRHLFRTTPGHRETVFDLRYCPENPSVVATCSFDSTIKLWDSIKMTCIKTLEGQKGIIYGISWSPNGKQIASCSSKGEVFIWDVSEGRVLHKINAHRGKPSFRICWSSNVPEYSQKNCKLLNLDNTFVASTAEDKSCAIIDPRSGNVVCRLVHPTSPFGCSWNIYDNCLATGSRDGSVRIWDIKSENLNQESNLGNGQHFRELLGHSSRVFNVVWNPVKKSILASGSDDKLIKIWDTARPAGSEAVSTLTGHTLNVRALVWSPEISWLIISGSWDGTIRLWDSRDGSALYVVKDHDADVYGIDLHPDRPFVLASTSRDTTIRFWNLKKLGTEHRLKILTALVLEEKNQYDLSLVPSLEKSIKAYEEYAGTSGRLQNILKGKSKIIDKISEFINFFYGANGIQDLCNLLKYCLGDEGSSSKTNIIHHSEKLCEISEMELDLVVKFEAAKVRHSCTKSHTFSNLKSLNTKSKTKLNKIVHGYCKIGKWKKACELLLSLGEDQKALAIAPSVSLDYWRRLSKEIAQNLLDSNNDQAITNMLASGDFSSAIRFLEENGSFNDAMLVAQGLREGNPNMHNLNTTDGSSKVKKKIEQKEFEVAYQAANHYLRNGDGIIGACIFLSINNYEAAVNTLLRACEPEIAFAIDACISLSLNNHRINDDVLKAYALTCEHMGLYKLALKVLDNTKEPVSLKQCLCARVANPKLYTLAGLQEPEHYTVQKRNQTKFEQIKSYLISGKRSAIDEGLEMALELLRFEFSKPLWDWNLIDDVVRYMNCVDVQQLPSKEIGKCVMAIASLRGALNATYKGLYNVVAPLYENVYDILNREPNLLDIFPVSMVQIYLFELKFWEARSGSVKNNGGFKFRMIKCIRKSQAYQSNNTMHKTSVSQTSELAISHMNSLARKFGIANDKEECKDEVIRIEKHVFDCESDEKSIDKSSPKRKIIPGKKEESYSNCNLEFHKPTFGLLNNYSRVAIGKHFPGHDSKVERRSFIIPHEVLRGPTVNLDGEKAIDLGLAMDWIEVNPFSPLNDGSRLELFK